MFQYGAWIHNGGNLSLEDQVRKAKSCGIQSIRSYSIDYSQAAAPVLKETGISLMAGMHIDADRLVEDWRSQVRFDVLEKYLQLGVRLEAICVGNELRQFGDHPDKKRFTARISFGLANVLAAYHEWLAKHGCNIPLTYAMEGIVFDRNGVFYEHLWPLIDACDIVSINLYPMGKEAWHGPTQFDESRLLLQDARVRNNRFLHYEIQLRTVLEILETVNKPLILSETGFPSAIGYDRDENGRIFALSDNESYSKVMDEFLGIIHQANVDYDDRIRAIYFYEWRDNQYHSKIDNVEGSPIHCAFGLCDRFGVPKFDIKSILSKNS
jgi:hypothetical protein